MKKSKSHNPRFSPENFLSRNNHGSYIQPITYTTRHAPPSPHPHQQSSAATKDCGSELMGAGDKSATLRYRLHT